MKVKHFIIVMILLGICPTSAWPQVVRHPLPVIREVWMDTPDASEVLGNGSWSIMPRREFNRILNEAKKVTMAESQLPWLISSEYEAKVDGLQMEGTADLLIHNPYQLAAWTTLSPWTMPLRQSGKSHPFSKELTVSSLKERTLGLLTRPQSTQRHHLNWGIQGEERNDGRWFLLQLPGCSQTTMNIIVPSPYRLDWPSSRQHLRGPFPVEGSQARRWQLQLGGEARQDVQVVVRNPIEERKTAWIEARLDADLVIHGQHVQARYELDLQRWHDRLRSITLDLPENLLIKSISIRHLNTESQLDYLKSSPTTVSLNFPESIEHRATVVIEGTSSIRQGDRTVFQVPLLRGAVSVKPTIRIVSMPAEPLIDWNWGDYFPQQLVSQDNSVDVLTLAPRLILDPKSLKPPSARQVERINDITYQQDTLWNIGRQTQRLTVRCQCTGASSQLEYLSWQVPTGWLVKNVTSDSATPIHAWTWHNGQPLKVQWPENRKSGEKNSLLIVLESITPLIPDDTPLVWSIPHLIPINTGRFNGSYAISLERTGQLLPPSLVVIKSPGIRSNASIPGPTEWQPPNTFPDLTWQLLVAAAGGSIQIQSWPATIRASLFTEIVDHERYPAVKYRMKLIPLAGLVNQWPVTFSSDCPYLLWASSPKHRRWNWNQQSATAGQMTWQEPLESAVELESQIPWKFGTPVPLLTSPNPSEAQLKLGQFEIPPSNWISKYSDIQKSESRQTWWYDNKTDSPVIKHSMSNVINLISPQIETSIRGSIAESVYSTILPPHYDTLHLSVPEQGELISCEVEGVSQVTKNPISIPASQRPVQLLLKYRSRVNEKSFFSSWHPVAPEWNRETTPSPRFHIIPDDQKITVLGKLSGFQKETVSQTMVWINRELLFVIIIIIFGVCLWLLCFRLTRRRFSPVVLAFCLILISNQFHVIAQVERTALVYILPGAAGKDDDERVMVPAALWQQIQLVAKQTAAGLSRSWWVSETNTEGRLIADRLQLRTVWSVTLDTDESIEIPWLENRSPEEIIIDHKTVQPRLITKPFGLQQWVIPVEHKGTHEIVIKWEVPIKIDGSRQSVEIRNPGAPYQKLNLYHVSDNLYIQGTNGIWTVKQQNGTRNLTSETGLSKSINISWLTPSPVPTQALVDVGVLWEHRIHQSNAFAVLAYHIDQGMLDEFSIELPTDVYLRNISLVGESQATVPPRIRQWNIEQVKGKQRLQVKLQRPVKGIVHLLLEMPLHRKANTSLLRLESLIPQGMVLRHNFVAYLADGVLVEPLVPLQIASTDEYDFARAWLPSLASLPSVSISRAVKAGSESPQLRLLPIPNSPHIQTDHHILVEQQKVQHHFQVEVKSQKPLVYLSCNIDPGLTINDVSGNRVIRWFQTKAKPEESSHLSVWFTSESGQSQDVSFDITAQQPVSVNDNQLIRLPLYQLKWNDAISQPTLLKLFSKRQRNIIDIQASTPLRNIYGPWKENSLIAVYEMPVVLPPLTAFQLQEDNTQAMPIANAAWDYSLTERCWVLMLSAPTGTVLPTQMDMIAKNDHIEQNWQFESNVALLFRPSRASGEDIVWSIQMSKPASQLRIKCYPLRDAQGKATQPSVHFPNWPDLKIPVAD